MNKQQFNENIEIPAITPKEMDGVVNLIEATDVVLSNIFYKSYYPKEVMKEFLKDETKRLEFIHQFMVVKKVGNEYQLNEDEFIALNVIAYSFGLIIDLSTGSVSKAIHYQGEQKQEPLPLEEMKCQCESDECVDYSGGFNEFMDILVDIGLLTKKTSKPSTRMWCDNVKERLKQSYKIAIESDERVNPFWVILSLFIVMYLVFSYNFSVVDVSGESMFPTIKNNEKVLVYKTKNLQRGNLALYYPSDERAQGKLYIKRVIAKGGDTLEYRNHRLYLNDRFLKEDYIHESEFYPETLSVEKIKENHYYFMGDNRNNSQDSRLYGQESKDVVYGKVVKIFKKKEEY